MELAQVKMVVTDMDGTLLNSKSEVSNQFFELFKSLRKHNIEFVAASGRQYNSIQEKLFSIYQDITIVAENGGFVKQDQHEIDSVHLNPQTVSDLMPVLRQAKGVFTVLCGKKTAYIESKDENFVRILQEYYTKFKWVEDLTKVNSDVFFKVAAYHFESSEGFIYPAVKHFEKDLQVKISGSNWVDISELEVNKGRAISLLQKKFDIDKTETMVFGDFNNDLEMIDRAYFSYAMENAHPNVKKAARFKTKSNNEAGVEIVLKELIQAKENGNINSES